MKHIILSFIITTFVLILTLIWIPFGIILFAIRFKREWINDKNLLIAKTAETLIMPLYKCLSL